MKTSLALFDFDGTLTNRDTMFVFCKQVAGPVRFFLGLLILAPMLVGFKLKMVDRSRAKSMFLRHFLGGLGRDELRRHGELFAGRVDSLLRPKGMEQLAWHRSEGHKLVLVSASLDLWLAAWAERQGLQLLCTGAAWTDDRFQGELATANCHGPEKVRRVKAALDPGTFDKVYAYGDSSGDTEMLAMSDEPSYRPFRD
jgi:phosphatidylglycerophosphatase C